MNELASPYSFSPAFWHSTSSSTVSHASPATQISCNISALSVPFSESGLEIVDPQVPSINKPQVFILPIKTTSKTCGTGDVLWPAVIDPRLQKRVSSPSINLLWLSTVNKCSPENEIFCVFQIQRFICFGYRRKAHEKDENKRKPTVRFHRAKKLIL